MEVAAKPASKSATDKTNATQKQIRGSSLLMFGKVISVGIHFATHFLIVRHLSQSEFGAWGIVLAVVALLLPFSSIGLKRSVPRFIPIYHENKEYEKLFGTIVLVLGTIFLTCLLIISAIFISPGLISKLISGDPSQSVNLLLIMIFMVPVGAIDLTLAGLFACFTKPHIILYQKHLLGPGLKLVVVVLLVLLDSSLTFLAYGYLAASLFGIVLYSIIFVRTLAKLGLLKHFDPRNLSIPFKEIFAFTIPLLTSDLVNILMHSTDTLLLGYFHGEEEVALYRVILPAAHFNKMVMTSFAFLYMPLAARLFAKKDFKGINELYWRTAIWMGVLSFPLFALTFSLAQPLTLTLYGARYEQAWIFLQMLSFGYYFNVVLGFNGLTLKVLGKVKYVVVVNVIAATLNLIGNLLLIPKYGVLGATIATTGSMIIHNILKQAGLRMASGLSVFDRQYFSFYLTIIVGAIGVYFGQQLFNNFYVGVLLLAAVSLAIFKICEDKLRVEETFPELLNLPLVRHLFKSKKRGSR